MMINLKLSSVCILSTFLMLGCVKKEEPQAQQETAVEEEVIIPETVEKTESEFTQLIEVPNDAEQSGDATILDESQTLSTNDRNTTSQDTAAPSQTAVANQPSTSYSDDAATEDDAIAAALKAAQPALQQ